MRFLALFLIIGILGLGACRPAEVLPGDRDLFVRADDLSEYGIEVRNTERHENFEKTRYFDGSVEIDYEFEPPESTDTIYMSETIRFEPKQADARIGRAAEDTGISLGLKIYGVEKEEIPNFYNYGDSSRFYALKKDGRNVGNYFTVIDGKKVFSLFVVGVYFDDPATWKGLVEPKLKLLSAYDLK